jgi:putative flippase GtrA
MLQKTSSPSPLQRLFSHVPPGQFARYLLVGVWNTVFGYATFVLFTMLLSRRYPQYGYIPAGVLSSILNISVAFFGYKWFIFKTKGNYLREWLRTMAVYGSSIAIGTALLPGVVFIVRHLTHIDKKAPYLAAAILSCVNVIFTFIGNKKFSFRHETFVEQEPAPKATL